MEYLVITLGSLLLALGLVLFLIPNKIAPGGVSGLATVIFHVFNLPVGATMLVLNIPLFLTGLRKVGLAFGMKSFFGTVVLSAFIDVLEPMVTAPTRDPLLASIYGGILAGVGLGLVFRAGGTTGGTDLATQIVRRYIKFSAGSVLMVIDGVVIALAGWVFSVELALYALVSLFVSARVIDLVQEGVGYFKAALIISEHSRQISQAILTQLNRGATALEGRGVYTGAEREVLLCVVSRPEVTKLKELVAQVDPRAFVIVTNVHEALGEGFKEISDW
ncbi:membrane protein [Clostridiales bacterium PH28_bin88]|nr:membrane protein [Clostridiales bacterium PH28_bin88]